MNFSLSFSYIFQDHDWFKKLILPGLCMLIPVIGWMVAVGWALKVTKNVIDGAPVPLPDLNFGEDILRGFFAFLISFIFSLPVTLLSSISGWIGNWTMFGMDHGFIVTGVASGIIGLTAFILGLVTSFLSLAATANYIAKDDLGAAFRLNEVFQLLKLNFGDWIVAALGILLAVGIIGPLGSIACIIGVFITLTYGLAVMGHLMGQAFLRSQVSPQI